MRCPKVRQAISYTTSNRKTLDLVQHHQAAQRLQRPHWSFQAATIHRVLQVLILGGLISAVYPRQRTVPTLPRSEDGYNRVELETGFNLLDISSSPNHSPIIILPISKTNFRFSQIRSAGYPRRYPEIAYICL